MKLASQMDQFPGGADQFGVRSPRVFHLCIGLNRPSEGVL